MVEAVPAGDLITNPKINVFWMAVLAADFETILGFQFNSYAVHRKTTGHSQMSNPSCV